MCGLVTIICHEPKYGNIDSLSFMQYQDSLTLSSHFFPEHKMDSVTKIILDDLLFSIDFDSLNMTKSCMAIF